MNKINTLLVAMSLSLPATVSADENQARLESAQAVTSQLLKTLGGELKKAMSTDGPVAAIEVCEIKAPQIAADLSKKTGWRITRVGTKIRNPALGIADEWESKVMADFSARASKGEDMKIMQFSEVVNESGTQYFRYMKAIGMAPQCVMCHGSKDQIPGNVHNVLKARYPMDLAVNYKPGELRGAVSIKQPMALPLPDTVSQ